MPKIHYFKNWIFVLWFLIWVSFGNFYEIEPEYTLKHENILTIFDQWLTTLNQWSTTFLPLFDHFSRFSTDFHTLDIQGVSHYRTFKMLHKNISSTSKFFIMYCFLVDINKNSGPKTVLRKQMWQGLPKYTLVDHSFRGAGW